MATGPEYLASPEKRLHDLIGALMLTAPAVASMPFSAAAATRYCQEDQSIIVDQKRLGLNGKPFTIYKFRSMWELHDNRDAVDPTSTLIDRRTDTLGNAIRILGLDESAQLFNVYRGDMSVISIRPQLEEARVRLSKRCSDPGIRRDWLALPQLAKPGIYGPGSDVAHLGMARHAGLPVDSQFLAEIDYVATASLAKDTKLLAMMPFQVARLAATAAHYAVTHSKMAEHLQASLAAHVPGRTPDPVSTPGAENQRPFPPAAAI